MYKHNSDQSVGQNSHSETFRLICCWIQCRHSLTRLIVIKVRCTLEIDSRGIPRCHNTSVLILLIRICERILCLKDDLLKEEGIPCYGMYIFGRCDHGAFDLWHSVWLAVEWGAEFVIFGLSVEYLVTRGERAWLSPPVRISDFIFAFAVVSRSLMVWSVLSLQVVVISESLCGSCDGTTVLQVTLLWCCVVWHGTHGETYWVSVSMGCSVFLPHGLLFQVYAWSVLLLHLLEAREVLSSSGENVDGLQIWKTVHW